MKTTTFYKIQGLARDRLAAKRAEAERLRQVASADPLAVGAVHRAIAAQAEADGFEQALREIVDGMIAAAVET